MFLQQTLSSVLAKSTISSLSLCHTCDFAQPMHNAFEMKPKYGFCRSSTYAIVLCIHLFFNKVRLLTCIVLLMNDTQVGNIMMHFEVLLKVR